MSGRPKTVFVRGTETELGEPVAAALMTRGATVALYDPKQPARAAALTAGLNGRGLSGRAVDLTQLTGGEESPDLPFAALQSEGLTLDAVVHLHLPDATTNEAALLSYPNRLRPMLHAAAYHMQQTKSQGIVVNQFVMPTLFVDHPLAAAMVEARNALTGITRHATVKYGRAGIRITGLMLGLLELPSLRALATERVKNTKTPLGRWLSVEEVTGTLDFLCLDSGYMTGQMLVLDGGMTGGMNGV
jgi:NAD(P)-dependent dehydrogenase (short-subunit alcohol dehydrogenase family)